MRGLAAGDTVALLLKSLKSSDPKARRSAALALESADADAEVVIPVLTQALSDSDASTQIAITRTLGQLGAAALPALLQAMNLPEKQVRREAVWALARLGPAAKKAASFLIAALRDADTKVRFGAAQALGAIGPKARAGIPALIECLRDSNLIFCRLAAQALVRIGPAALPALQEASQSPDEYVRREAQWALKHLGQSTSEASSVETATHRGLATPEHLDAHRNKEGKRTVRVSLHPKNIDRTTFIDIA
jgi:HEAT repeat protein